jgi:hypothetical protein
MLTDELLKTIQAERERQIAQAQRERLTRPEPADPEPWTWLRDGPAGGRQTIGMRRPQTGRAAADSSL